MDNTEMAIISCLLTDTDCLSKVYDTLKPEMFTDAFCRDSYTEIVRMYDLSEKVTVYGLQQRLETDFVDSSDIMAFLKDCLAQVSLSADIKHYADTVINEYKARELKKLLERVSLKPKDIKDSLAEVIAQAEAIQGTECNKGRSSKDIVDSYENDYFKEKPIGVTSDIAGLDDIITDFGKGDVAIIGARPAVGKSALATQICVTLAKKGLRVGYFNLEMGEQQIFERLVAKESGIELNRIRRATNFLGEEQQKYQKATELLKMKNFIIFSGSYTAGEMKNVCRNQDFSVVVVDYLQLIKPDKEYGNRVAEVGNISKTLKALAMELNVPVIALSQLSRKTDETKEPELADLRESGDIEQDASTVILMWNISDDRKYNGLKVAKNRQGTLGKIALEFKGENMTFIESDKDLKTLEKELKVQKKYKDENPFD